MLMAVRGKQYCTIHDLQKLRCAAMTERGTRCSARTMIGEFCLPHYAKKNGLKNRKVAGWSDG